MAYQSLYRRYRPQRFDEVRGQGPVTQTLRNAVRDGRVAHAYLFSGPRGTGKTSTARILAKALNCAAPSDGEPCGRCDSCIQVTAGTSFDVHELDAASNNRIEEMRELVARAALGTPGRWKVYIVDEVHMLSVAASNALLKTLEEPPAHVVFVLATTNPQRVLPTIRSRAQHFEFRLLPPDLLVEHLTWVADDAGLDVPPEAIELVARRGSGSARDALSALDQVAAGGAIDDDLTTVDDLVEALCERDAGRALAAVAEACAVGRDPRHLTRDLVERLRAAFLTIMAKSLVGVPDAELERLEDQGRRMGAALAVRSVEVLGEALVAMREAVDPRIGLEVALVRLARPESDTSLGALLERVERLERGLADRASGPSRAAAHDAVAAPPAPPAPTPSGGPASQARAALGAYRPPQPPSPPPLQPEQQKAPEPPAEAGGTLPSRDELVLAWPEVLARLQGARARFSAGRFVAVEEGAAVYALPNAVHRERCEERRSEAEEALAAHFGRRVPLTLIVDPGPSAPPREAVEDEVIDLTDLRDAPTASATSPLDHLTQVFPGAQLVEE